MPGTFSPTPRVIDPDMHHGTCVTHVPWCMTESITSGFLWSRRRGKHSRHSRRMRNPQCSVSGKRPIYMPMLQQCDNDNIKYKSTGTCITEFYFKKITWNEWSWQSVHITHDHLKYTCQHVMYTLHVLFAERLFRHWGIAFSLNLTVDVYSESNPLGLCESLRHIYCTERSSQQSWHNITVLL